MHSLFCLLLGAGLLLQMRARNGAGRYNGFLIILVAIIVAYFLFPNVLLTGGFLLVRLKLTTLILLCCCIAPLPLPAKVVNSSALIVFACVVVFSLVYLPDTIRAGTAAEDLVAAGKYISPHTVVLPLNFGYCGQDANGKPLTEHIEVFR